MRCAVCSGPLLFDRIDKEYRCLICGRILKRSQRPDLEDPDNERREYPRRYGKPQEQRRRCG